MLNDVIQGLRNQLKSSEEDCHALKESLAAVRLEHSSLEGEIEGARNSLSQRTLELQYKCQEVISLQSALDAAKMEGSEIRASILKVQTMLNEQITSSTFAADRIRELERTGVTMKAELARKTYELELATNEAVSLREKMQTDDNEKVEACRKEMSAKLEAAQKDAEAQLEVTRRDAVAKLEELERAGVTMKVELARKTYELELATNEAVSLREKMQTDDDEKVEACRKEMSAKLEAAQKDAEAQLEVTRRDAFAKLEAAAKVHAACGPQIQSGAERIRYLEVALADSQKVVLKLTDGLNQLKEVNTNQSVQLQEKYEELVKENAALRDSQLKASSEANSIAREFQQQFAEVSISTLA